MNEKPPIPMVCPKCDYRLDYEIGCGTPFPPYCENGCRTFGHRMVMKLFKTPKEKGSEPVALADIVM